MNPPAADVIKSGMTNPQTKGNVGSAMLPGSTQVWDRAAQKLVPCTQQLCSDSIVSACWQLS